MLPGCLLEEFVHQGACLDVNDRLDLASIRKLVSLNGVPGMCITRALIVVFSAGGFCKVRTFDKRR